MKVVTYSYARNALKSILDDVVRDAVVMSLDSYNRIMEKTLHLTIGCSNGILTTIPGATNASGVKRMVQDGWLAYFRYAMS